MFLENTHNKKELVVKVKIRLCNYAEVTEVATQLFSGFF